MATATTGNATAAVSPPPPSDGFRPYRITVDDPKTWSRPWSAMIPMKNLDRHGQELFEYACHEDNYGMYGILAGARQKDKEAAEAKRGLRQAARDAQLPYALPQRGRRGPAGPASAKLRRDLSTVKRSHGKVKCRRDPRWQRMWRFDPLRAEAVRPRGSPLGR